MNATDQLAPSFTSKPNERPASMVAGGAPRTGDWPQFLKDQPTVTMIFAMDVSLNLDDYAGLVHFKKGVAEVPESLVNHWYLRRYAKVYEKPVAAAAEPSPEEMAAKLREAGFEVSVKPHTDFSPQAAASSQDLDSLLPKVVDKPKREKGTHAAAKRQS